MARKFCYFDVNGIAEGTRYMLHYAAIPFEDVRYDKKATWPQMKENLPFGQLPVLEEDGKKLHQSMAIARYVGAKAGLVPQDAWQAAILDATVLSVYDFWQKAIAMVYTAEDKAQGRKEFMAEVVPYYLGRFEKQLKDNNGFLHNGKVSWADFMLVGLLEAVDTFAGVECFRQYPAITKLASTVHGYPAVKAYITKRRKYDLNY